MAMTDTEFHQLADEIFSAIDSAIESAIDDDGADVDIDYSGNVVQLTFEDNSQIVINKQEPLHEIWLATKTGGYHFAYDNGKWYDSRNNKEFVPFVLAEIAKQGGITITL